MVRVWARRAGIQISWIDKSGSKDYLYTGLIFVGRAVCVVVAHMDLLDGILLDLLNDRGYFSSSSSKGPRPSSSKGAVDAVVCAADAAVR